jgi:hypothetical protein
MEEKTMQIGILTITGTNFGSILQATATKKFLESLGHDVSVIRSTRLNGLPSWIEISKPTFSTFNIKKQMTFINDCRNLNLTSPRKYYDAIIVGSDVVWMRTGKGKHLDRFFGLGLNTDNLIAYAPCSHKTTYGEISEKRMEGLRSFNSLSVRDKVTQDLLYQITGEKCPLVLDPTFLIDWEQYAITPFLKNYILVYCYEGRYGGYSARKMVIDAKEMSRKTGYPIVCVMDYASWADKCYNATTQEFLGWVKNAHHVFTSAFHGTIFSVIFKKPFTTYVNTPKLTFLTQQLGIESGKPFNDYSKIDLTKEIQESKNYLKRALEE